MEKYLTPVEVAEILRVKRLTVYRWIDAGKLPFKRAGKKILIPENALSELVNQTEEQTYGLAEQVKTIYDRVPENADRVTIISLLQELEQVLKNRL